MKSLTVVLLLILAQEPGRDILNQGVRAFREGRYQDAIASFEEAVRLSPGWTVAELYLARAYLQQYVPGSQTAESQQIAQRAIERFESVLEKEPNNAAAVAGLASIYQNSGLLGKAREFHLRNAALNPLDAVAFYQVAAIDWILAANRKASELPAPHERDGFIEEGLRYVDIALSIDPNFEDAMSYKNLLLREKAKWTTGAAEKSRLIGEADHWFNRALESRRNKQSARRMSSDLSPIPPPPPPPPPPARIRIGGTVAQSKVIFRPDLVYPAEASQARIQGSVVMEAIISTEGLVSSLTLISGHPLLAQAALENAKQWRFEPTILNGVPTEIVTTLTVTFALQ
ncbi:MAG: TonB family protein [Acidobacteria bacterium]|nr:TonB family protein [Acidobacteriota bacterium]